ncbi:MAG: Lrp/AsnC family transcriptional regulator [archaeon]
MNTKLRKLLYALSVNSRITTKELGKYTRASQQSASYLLNSIEKKKWVFNYQTIIDPAKFGLINVMVLYNFLDFEAKNDVIGYLEQSPYIVKIESCAQGADILVEYCVPNLSLFNKEDKTFLQTFKRKINNMAIYPIIVKHIYNPAFLINKTDDAEIVVSGDRDAVNLSSLQKKVLLQLQNNARISMFSIAQKLKIDPKTVVGIRKYLKKNKIIRKYSVILEAQNIPVYRTHTLLNIDYRNVSEINKFLQFVKQHKNVVQVFKIIGSYEFFLTIDHVNLEVHVLREIREHFQVARYAILESEKIFKQQSIPDVVLMND